MGYQALYRVWRPQTFDELVGQDMIAETLKNAITNGQLSHAYLFTGPRGTGKTSAAKILAKSVNCSHQEDGNPCNECDLCQAITSGQLSDVIEIDAASNNGVEEIRDLRDKVRYAPTQAKYKVYIIDEVHMLTTGAFNALLKTLEEPPAQVIFILATTEPHKIPATIISRTQRFDFQRIQARDLISRMQHILDHDHIAYEEEALAIIARAANGGMRDALSLLDQALSYNNQEVTVVSALEVSGSLDQKDYIDYLLALKAGQAQQALSFLQTQLAKGKQASRFIEELILFSRDLLLTLHTKHNHTLLNEAELQEVRQTIPADFYYHLIHQLNSAQNQMRFSNQPDLYLEVITVQLAQGDHSQVSHRPEMTADSSDSQWQEKVRFLEESVMQLQTQVATLQETLRRQAYNQPDVEVVEPVNEGHKLETTSVQPAKTPRPRPEAFKTDYQLEVNQVYRVLNQATKTDIQELKAQWSRILAELSPVQRAKFFGTQPLAAGPSLGLIAFDNLAFCGAIQHDADLRERVERIASQILGHNLRLEVILTKDWQGLRQDYMVLRKQNGGQPLDLPETEDLKEVSQNDQDDYDAPEQTPADERLVQSEVEDVAASMDFDNSVPVQEKANREPTTQTSLTDPEADNLLLEDQMEEPPLPEVVARAVELFGSDKVNVFDE
ncbi:DNA polymerase III subunit gamma/tau [Vaginisenegalia massiliensis]|uniref:DNA polymerase III subunit gamma/tau n=1 Tax=Vaginisenegalia massiliensis TaxID=2058294 RepID=UPI000F5447D6|nr:DNA polymerase III subunit gamma/tau [Vaginisenegalia massiliensis]